MGYNASAVVSLGPDPIVGSLLNTVYNGSYAARVNDWYNNNSISVISQTVTNYTDPFIYFAWAAVLESSHYSTDSDNLHTATDRRDNPYRLAEHDLQLL